MLTSHCQLLPFLWGFSQSGKDKLRTCHSPLPIPPLPPLLYLVVSPLRSWKASSSSPAPHREHELFQLEPLAPTFCLLSDEPGRKRANLEKEWIQQNVYSDFLICKETNKTKVLSKILTFPLRPNATAFHLCGRDIPPERIFLVVSTRIMA